MDRPPHSHRKPNLSHSRDGGWAASVECSLGSLRLGRRLCRFWIGHPPCWKSWRQIPSEGRACVLHPWDMNGWRIWTERRQKWSLKRCWPRQCLQVSRECYRLTENDAQLLPPAKILCVIRLLVQVESISKCQLSKHHRNHKNLGTATCPKSYFIPICRFS